MTFWHDERLRLRTYDNGCIGKLLDEWTVPDGDVVRLQRDFGFVESGEDYPEDHQLLFTNDEGQYYLRMVQGMNFGMRNAWGRGHFFIDLNPVPPAVPKKGKWSEPPPPMWDELLLQKGFPLYRSGSHFAIKLEPWDSGFLIFGGPFVTIFFDFVDEDGNPIRSVCAI